MGTLRQRTLERNIKMSFCMHRNTFECIDKRVNEGTYDRSRVVERDLCRYYSLIEAQHAEITSRFTEEELAEITAATHQYANIEALRTMSCKTIRIWIYGLIADGHIGQETGIKIHKNLSDLDLIALVDYVEIAALRYPAPRKRKA